MDLKQQAMSRKSYRPGLKSNTVLVLHVHESTVKIAVVQWLKSLSRSREIPGSILIGNTTGIRQKGNPAFKVLH